MTFDVPERKLTDVLVSGSGTHEGRRVAEASISGDRFRVVEGTESGVMAEHSARRLERLGRNWIGRRRAVGRPTTPGAAPQATGRRPRAIRVGRRRKSILARDLAAIDVAVDGDSCRRRLRILCKQRRRVFRPARIVFAHGHGRRTRRREREARDFALDGRRKRPRSFRAGGRVASR